jgi:hypothetical protein
VRQLAGDLTPVSTEEGLKFAATIAKKERRKTGYYVECSPRTGENVDQVFELAVKSVLFKIREESGSKKVTRETVTKVFGSTSTENVNHDFGVTVKHVTEIDDPKPKSKKKKKSFFNFLS